MKSKKIFTLSTCSTCKKILGDLDTSKCEIQDIKQQSISGNDLDFMKELAGSYEALFSRRANKYKDLKLKDKNLTEKDYRKLILDEYTFLKRPVIVVGKKIFIGNTNAQVTAAQKELNV
ncbi:MAG: ArsC/Spx/MgsR family protein [Saprospiraceae bacterium]